MLSDIMKSINGHQKLAKLQGDRFHAECIDALTMAGFEIAEQHFVVKDVGIELDCITNNRHGLAMAWEFKGSWQGERPGLRRTDTLKKAISNGYLFTQSDMYQMMPPLIVMTSHLPEKGDGLAMLHAVKRDVIMAFLDSRDSKALKWFYNAIEETIEDYIKLSTRG
jgi:hypothetical protein